MMHKPVPGSEAFASVFKGQRYLFPSKKERTMFDASPAAYAIQGLTAAVAPAGSVRVVGKTACAGCSYGVRPTTDANSLGIAVVTESAVYVVEGGERRYPQLFEARFDGIDVELRGAVRKQQGKFVWVEPTGLSRVR
jgi:YHS domain-containing protein